MNITMPAQQRGITLSGLLVGAFLLVVFGIFGLKLIPAYMENAEIISVFNEIVHDPDMQKAPAQDIRGSFDKRASINNIKALKSGDIDIANDQGRLVLSASYFVKVPLGGNLSLYLDFNPTSGQ